MADSEELNSLLRSVQEECEKAGLKLNIQKTTVMASHPITSWQTVDATTAMKLKDACSLEESYDKPRQKI